jgi:excisionase family DNA binding protein
MKSVVPASSEASPRTRQEGSTRSSTTQGGTTPTGISFRSQDASGQRAIPFTGPRCLKTSRTSPASAPTSPKHRRNRYARAVERFSGREPNRSRGRACLPARTRPSPRRSRRSPGSRHDERRPCGNRAFSIRERSTPPTISRAHSVRARAVRLLINGQRCTHRGELLRVNEVATVLRCSRSSVYRRIDDGSLPAYRLGNGPLRVRAGDVEQLYGRGRRAPRREDRSAGEAQNIGDEAARCSPATGTRTPRLPGSVSAKPSGRHRPRQSRSSPRLAESGGEPRSRRLQRFVPLARIGPAEV